MEQLFLTIEDGDVVIFTSATAAEECGRSHLFQRSMKDARIISIGSGTAAALEHLGVAAGEIPSEYSSEGIVEHLRGSVAGKRVIVIRSDHGSQVLSQGLTPMGADVIEFAAYSLKPADPRGLEEMLDAGRLGRIDVFAFTSPLTVRSFVDAAENKAIDLEGMFGKATVAAIGVPTADMLTSLGINVDVMPESATFEEMLFAIKRRIEEKK